MGGPACSILVRHPTDVSLLAALDELVRRVACNTEGDHFWVADTSSIGGTYNGEARPFAFEMEDLLESYEPSDLRMIEQAFGWLPSRESLVIIAMCGSPVDHRILGEMTLWLASKLDGLVHFDGVLEPPSTPAGRLAQVPCLIEDQRHGLVEVADPVAFGDLLRSPTFYLVK